MALPVVNLLTTDKHLINSLVQQDWGLAGFDLTFLVVGSCFAFSAYKYEALQVEKKVRKPSARQGVNQERMREEKKDSTLGDEDLLSLPSLSKGNR
jgi:hypothetical protein